MACLYPQHEDKTSSADRGSRHGQYQNLTCWAEVTSYVEAVASQAAKTLRALRIKLRILRLYNRAPQSLFLLHHSDHSVLCNKPIQQSSHQSISSVPNVEHFRSNHHEGLHHLHRSPLPRRLRPGLYSGCLRHLRRCSRRLLFPRRPCRRNYLHPRYAFKFLPFPPSTLSLFDTSLGQSPRSNLVTDNPLSISHIRTYNYASCTFKGVDGSNTVLNGPGSVDVGPPQTQISGRCTRAWQR